MALPSKPVRKAAKTSNDMLARPTSKSVPGSSAYNRKTASPVGKTAYVRKSVGITPQSQDTNRTNGDAAQPHNNRGGSKMSRKMKGVD